MIKKLIQNIFNRPLIGPLEYDTFKPFTDIHTGKQIKFYEHPKTQEIYMAHSKYSIHIVRSPVHNKQEKLVYG